MKPLFTLVILLPITAFAQAPFAAKTKFKDLTAEEFLYRAKRQGIDQVYIKNVKTDVATNFLINDKDNATTKTAKDFL